MKAGDVFEIDYPFFRDKVSLWTEEGLEEFDTWVPGVRYEMVYIDESKAIADGVGKMILTIIDVHKPGKYPTRIFYTRKWKDPDGNVFGKNLLKIRVNWSFNNLLKGYLFDYQLKRKLNGIQ